MGKVIQGKGRFVERRLLNDDYYQAQVVQVLRPPLDAAIGNVELALNLSKSVDPAVEVARLCMVTTALTELTRMADELLREAENRL